MIKVLEGIFKEKDGVIYRMAKILEGRFEEKDGVIYSDLLKRERDKLGFDKSTEELIKIAKEKKVLEDDNASNSDYIENYERGKKSER